MNSENALLNTKQVAKLLGISPRTLESWRQQEIGPPCFRISPAAIRYRPEDLQGWLTQLAPSRPNGGS